MRVFPELSGPGLVISLVICSEREAELEQSLYPSWKAEVISYFLCSSKSGLPQNVLKLIVPSGQCTDLGISYGVSSLTPALLGVQPPRNRRGFPV